MGYCVNTEVGGKFTAAIPRLEHRVAECIVADSEGNVAYGWIHDAKVPDHFKPNAYDMSSFIESSLYSAGKGLFGWYSDLPTVWSLRCTDCKEYSLSRSSPFGKGWPVVSAERIHELAGISYLLGYSSEYSVGEIYPFTWDRVGATIYSESAWAGNLSIVALYDVALTLKVRGAPFLKHSVDVLYGGIGRRLLDTALVAAGASMATASLDYLSGFKIPSVWDDLPLSELAFSTYEG